MEGREILSITDLVLNFSLNFSLMLWRLVVEKSYRMTRELSRGDELLNNFLDSFDSGCSM